MGGLGFLLYPVYLHLSSISNIRTSESKYDEKTILFKELRSSH